MILKMIVEGYDLPQHYILDVEKLKSSCNSRLMKYKVPEKNQVLKNSLVPHTDQNGLTILCQNEVQGLQVLSKTGKWIELEIPQNGFVVIVGDILKVHMLNNSYNELKLLQNTHQTIIIMLYG